MEPISLEKSRADFGEWVKRVRWVIENEGIDYQV
jgi:hypothetical protein